MIRSRRPDGIQFDLDQMFDTLAELNDVHDAQVRFHDVRIAHLNRMIAQVSEAARSPKRIEDDPARHWQPETAVAS